MASKKANPVLILTVSSAVAHTALRDMKQVLREKQTRCRATTDEGLKSLMQQQLQHQIDQINELEVALRDAVPLKKP